jgi:hypothetical protein
VLPEYHLRHPESNFPNKLYFQGSVIYCYQILIFPIFLETRILKYGKSFIQIVWKVGARCRIPWLSWIKIEAIHLLNLYRYNFFTICRSRGSAYHVLDHGSNDPDQCRSSRTVLHQQLVENINAVQSQYWPLAWLSPKISTNTRIRTWDCMTWKVGIQIRKTALRTETNRR